MQLTERMTKSESLTALWLEMLMAHSWKIQLAHLLVTDSVCSKVHSILVNLLVTWLGMLSEISMDRELATLMERRMGYLSDSVLELGSERL